MYSITQLGPIPSNLSTPCCCALPNKILVLSSDPPKTIWRDKSNLSVVSKHQPYPEKAVRSFATYFIAGSLGLKHNKPDGMDVSAHHIVCCRDINIWSRLQVIPYTSKPLFTAGGSHSCVLCVFFKKNVFVLLGQCCYPREDWQNRSLWSKETIFCPIFSQTLINPNWQRL